METAIVYTVEVLDLSLAQFQSSPLELSSQALLE